MYRMRRDFMMTSREFLPPERAFVSELATVSAKSYIRVRAHWSLEIAREASAPSATGPDEDMLRFQEELHRRQHPQQCDGNFPWYWCPYGTSACFHLLSRPEWSSASCRKHFHVNV